MISRAAHSQRIDSISLLICLLLSLSIFLPTFVHLRVLLSLIIPFNSGELRARSVSLFFFPTGDVQRDSMVEAREGVVRN